MKKNNAFFEKAQRFGKSFMLPIAVLPAAGLLLGIGGAFSNSATIEAYPFLDISWLQGVFTVMSSAGNIIFSNLPVIFAIGIAIGLARSDKGTAGLAAMFGFLVMHATINAMLAITGQMAETDIAGAGQGMVLGIQSLETGVFGGILTGILTYWLHQRYNKIELPRFLGFFGGSRFIPIITSFASIFLGIILFYFWPFVQAGITQLGQIVDATGYIGTLIYGFVLRLLGPFGLHHIFYLPFWQTSLGGSMVIDGSLIEGTQNIFFAQLAQLESVDQFFLGTARFMSGRHITMMFGLLGACLAIYHTAKPENKKKVLGLMLSAGLTSFLTGITEPIEFSFLFIAPVLYVIHAFFDGLAFMFAHIFEITIGQTFSGGFIDFLLFGVFQGAARTNWFWVPIIGVPWFFLYYFTFRFMIKKFNYKTPGRDQLETEEASLSKTERASAIINQLGGEANIKDVDACATRLRVSVFNSELVNKDGLKQTGAHGVVVSGNGVQVIYGPQVTGIKNEVEEALGDQ
ncbi:PTS transporter subunit EIIC [Amphibacillus sediminis]|uniref:PTS transporter subunit EIIC n=1 Tax=Amphibacillus sediminis TaxID=360185 RepID=UPI00082CED26|nr:PTS transporter subunit EIIC [Amphibacillus sediminis]